mgnify:FL=1
MLNKLGKYEIQAVLGQGAMGIVYRAYDPILKRPVALKTLSGDFGQNPELLKRFYREAEAAGGLRHFNIVTIYDLGEENHTPFIAMEFLEGCDLQNAIQQQQIQSLYQVLRIARQSCEALHYAHGRGIVHRDVKPANVFLLEDGTVKIVDFGIAQMASSTMTRTGMVMGTVSYMSPEQVQGRNLDGRSDQFSMGIIVYEMLTGTKPFHGSSIPEIFFKIMNEPPAPIRQQYPHCPPALEAILQRCLMKDRDQRYPDLSQMARDLERLLASLNREFSLQEAVAFGGERSGLLWQEAVNDIQQLFQDGQIDQAQLRLDDLRRQWGDADPLLNARLDSLQGSIRLARNRTSVQKHLDNIQALARDGQVTQAELLLDRLEEEYSGQDEILQTRGFIIDAKRRGEKIHFIRGTISKAKVFLEAENHDQALKTLEQAMRVYPEEKALLKYYQSTLERKAQFSRKAFIRDTCANVSARLKDGQLETAIRTVEAALERFADEEVFQNLYKTLIARKRGIR